MPTNKHASFRYRVLNQCFTNRGRRKWRLEELMEETSRYLREEFGVDIVIGKRTIQGDLNIMRSRPPRGFNAPIACVDRHYFYTDPEYSIEKPPIGVEELEVLRETLLLAGQMPGIAQLPMVESLAHRFSAGNAVAVTSSPVRIQFETNTMVRGTEWITPIYEAIKRQKVLKIGYHPFMDVETDYLLHPYLLKEWRNRWFVFGREEKGKIVPGHSDGSWRQSVKRGFIPRMDGICSLPLDRITRVASMPDVPFQTNDLFDPLTWFDDIVGVTRPEHEEPVEIQLEVDPLISYYVETKPLHRSQRLVSRDEERATFMLRLIPNYELISDILAYGKYIRVLSPPSFITKLQETRNG